MSKQMINNVTSPVQMIDVTAKKETVREAVAKGRIEMNTATLERIRQGEIIKGDVLAVAQTAGILAAKDTQRLIPLCHPLLLTNIWIEFYLPPDGNFIEITAIAKGIGKTGFEMEAFVAVAVSALNIYDMCKAIDKSMRITDIRLLKKSGGKSGTYVASGDKEKIVNRCGKIVAVCIGTGKDKKEQVSEAVLQEGYGVVGDVHAGSSRQVSLLAQETIDKMIMALSSINPQRMKAQNIRINPGDSAENLLTKDIDLISLPVGTIIHIGNEAIIRVSQLGKEYHKPGYYLIPLEGIFASVIKGGIIKPGDDVIVQDNS
jgi:cyclic pyranopterin monophosphate synthase